MGSSRELRRKVLGLQVGLVLSRRLRLDGDGWLSGKVASPPGAGIPSSSAEWRYEYGMTQNYGICFRSKGRWADVYFDEDRSDALFRSVSVEEERCFATVDIHTSVGYHIRTSWLIARLWAVLSGMDGLVLTSSV
ncbi:hypothetical protein PCH_Pc22g14130 [Penicillium rubens Wisconsin 54-1255]|uniref:Uncharacterized protein n=1 Tax=Penicillium rubens (strain ATCC 28089 / DSM 1075 / NRRL 1951 / Wisconsin 54-1255) TaxID=500485 RepID=B6HUH8_PENRW|nr:hypothetical protein PCH_Pc22g14130 [Penicillium rubens Wisconsin 54-1255]